VTLLLIPSLQVAESQESAPKPPLVASVPDPFSWTIEVRQKRARPTLPDDPKQATASKRLEEIYPRITSVTVEKAGKNRHEETVYDNG